MHMSMKMRSNLSQFAATIIKSLDIVSLGFILGYGIILIPNLIDENENFKFTKDEISWISSLHAIFGVVGCIISGTITHLLGPKRTMQLVNLPIIIGWLLLYFSVEKWHIFLALSITGVTYGLVETPTILYITELIVPSLRGTCYVIILISGVIGTLIMYLLGIAFRWRSIALICSGFNTIAFCIYVLLPESPYWLIANDKVEEAKKCLAWLRGWTDFNQIQAEYEQITKDLHPIIEAKKQNWKYKLRNCKEMLKTVSKKRFLWPCSLLVPLLLISSLCGSPQMHSYASIIFNTLHISVDSYYATLYMGISDVLGGITSTFLISRCGKRWLNIIVLILTIVACLTLGTYVFHMGVFNLELSKSEIKPQNVDLLEKYSWIPLSLILIVCYTTQVGIKMLPVILLGEILTSETRLHFTGLFICLGLVGKFLSIKLFFNITDMVMLPGLFWFFAGVNLLGCIFVYFFIPETEGRSLKDIDEHFSGGNKLSNNFRRKGASYNVSNQKVTDSNFSEERHTNLGKD